MNVIIEFTGTINCKDMDTSKEVVEQVDVVEIEKMLKEDMARFIIGNDDELNLSVTSVKLEE